MLGGHTEPMLFDGASEPFGQVIAPAREISAYEALWRKQTTVKRMADLFRSYSHALPSAVAKQEGISEEELASAREELRALLPFSNYSAVFYGDFEYPQRLQDARHPIELLYYRGALDLLSSDTVSVVGARQCSEPGLRRARRVSRLLAEAGFTVMSGLAEGVDTAAHEAALEAGGRTVAVVGTPLSAVYPRSNTRLHDRIVAEHLVVSQVPFLLASERTWQANRTFFPERNKTMSALSLATVIVEASETSGTLFQARAALQQGRKLFILNSCFESGLEWPETFLAKGAIRVAEPAELLEKLPKPKSA